MWVSGASGLGCDTTFLRTGSVSIVRVLRSVTSGSGNVINVLRCVASGVPVLHFVINGGTGEDKDVVALYPDGEGAYNALKVKSILTLDAGEHLQGFGLELPTGSIVFHAPLGEEHIPVEVFFHRIDVVMVEAEYALAAICLTRGFPFATGGLGHSQTLVIVLQGAAVLGGGVKIAQPLLLCQDAGNVHTCDGTLQLVYNLHVAAGVGGVDHQSVIFGSHLYGCVHRARCGSAHNHRNGDTGLLEVAQHHNHLLQRRGDEAAEAHIVSIVGLHRLYNGAWLYHHAQVHDAATAHRQHHRNDILSDVVDVTLHGCDHNPRFRLEAIVLIVRILLNIAPTRIGVAIVCNLLVVRALPSSRSEICGCSRCRGSCGRRGR